MSDDLVKQSIAELQEIVHCNCGSAYLERGRHSHACLHYMADALKIVTDRIEELETKLAKAVDALHIIAVNKTKVSRLADAKFVARTTLTELTGGKDG